MRSEQLNSGYLRAARRAPILEQKVEFDLARRWREEGDEAALHSLVQSYARYVIAIAARFQGYGLPLGDLVQEGNVGLMEAAARFDYTRDVRFGTYAAYWIRAAIHEYILRHSATVRIGTTPSQKSLFFNLRRMRARLSDNLDGVMRDEDRRKIAAMLKVPVAAVERMEAHLGGRDRSLNAPLGDSESESQQDILVDPSPSPAEVVEDRLDGRARKAWIEEALADLSDRERDIVEQRFSDDERITLANLAEQYGVSKERVRQIEARALGKLRKSLQRRGPEAMELLS
ncbi:MAG: RNA polymerase factor sigma-32 [Alphaproteobacteria bacterium]|nr:RNA polymerase factor sigma-32 [Alphaproteobacteria bacterium]